MKHRFIKWTAALFVTLFAISVIQPTQAASIEANEDWKAMYTQFLSQYVQPEIDAVDFGISLMDINMDGTPELVLGSQSYYRDHYIYTISKGKVVKLGGFSTNSQSGIPSAVDVKLYRNKKTKAFQWVAKSGTTEFDDDGIRTTLIDMNAVWSKTPSFFANTDTSENKKHWKVNNAETSKATYESKYKTCFANLEAQSATVRVYAWDPKGTVAERAPIIEKIMKEYQPIGTAPTTNTKLQYASYRPASNSINLQKDFDFDGKKDNLILSKGPNAPKLVLNMSQVGSVSMELKDYEWGSFKKIMSGDITGDGVPEILVLAEMGGNGAAGGGCALYGFSRMNGQWSAMSFPFLDRGAIRSSYAFKGQFTSTDIIKVICQPSNKTVDVVNNDKIKFSSNYRTQTYESGELTDIEFMLYAGDKAYDLQLLQEVRNDARTESVGNGITRFSFKIGNGQMISQSFQFTSPFGGQ